MKKIKKQYIYVAFLALMLIVHSFIGFFGDDLWFMTKLDENKMLDFLVFRYQNWSSRLFTEALLVIVTRNIYLWRILDSLVCLLCVYSINKLFFKESNSKNVLLCCGIFLLFPMNDMSSAGFAASTTNYLWCVSFMCYAFIPFRNIYYGETINKCLLPSYILAMLYACNQEQSVCIFTGISLLFLLYCLKNKFDYKFVLFYLIIGIVGFIFMMTAPGNASRTVSETVNRFPDYINANIFDKLQLGMVSMFSTILNNVIIYWLFSFVLMLFINCLKGNKLNKIISIIQFVFVSFIFVLRFYDSALHKKYSIFNYNTETGHVFNLLCFVACLLIIGLYCYLLCVLYKKKGSGIVLLFLIGLASRIIMGFSPTVIFSDSRTTAFTYFTLLIIILILIRDFSYKLNKKKNITLNYTLIFLIVLNYARLSVLSAGLLKLISSL